jgi:flagellar motility protein MotE (MotC chaperone)
MSGPARLLPVTIAALVAVLGIRTVGLLADLRAGAGARLISPAAAETVAPPPPPTACPPAGADQVAAANTPLSAPPVSDSERAILLALRQRRGQLDARESQVAAREALVAASAQRLQARLNELTALQDKLQALEDARHQREAANWSGLVKVYESMKPKDAAGIFDDLDMSVLLPVVDRMKEQKAAAIMAAMDPAKARALTTSIAQSRLGANRLPGDAAAAAGGG